MLIVGGVTVPVSIATPPTRDTREIGDYTPAWDGTDLGVIISRKKTWGVTTTLMTQAAADALEAEILTAPPILCYGDMLGTPPGAFVGSPWYCRGTVTGYNYVSVPGGYRIAMSFTLVQA